MKKLFALLLFAFATTLNAASVTLQWDAPATGVPTTYHIERKAVVCGGPGAFTEITTVPATQLTFVDSTLVPGTDYCFRVAASNPTSKSAYSNTLGHLPPVPTVPVGPPLNLRIIQVIGLNWDAAQNAWVVVSNEITTE